MANDNNNNNNTGGSEGFFELDLEKLNRDLETLRRVNKEAYESIEELHEQQKLLTRAKELGAITEEEYKKKVEETTEALDEEGEKLLELIKEQDRLTEAQEKYNKTLEAGNKLYGLFRSAQSKVISTTSDLTGVNLSHLSTMTSMVAASAKYVREQDKLEVGLRRSTGYANRHTKSFNGLKDSFLAAGLTSTDLSTSISSLSNNFAGFDAMSKTNRENLITLSGKFKQLGMDANQFAETVDKLTFAYGFMGSSAVDAMNKVEEIANTIGRAPATVSKDLIALGPELARFGNQGIKVFEKLAKKARSLGLGVKQAFDVTELFDTFESAANVAGRLNAQLGLQLNSVEMMKASSEERLDMLRQEFKMKGIDFKTSGRRQKQMIASILGVDVETAGRLLGDGMDMAKFRAEKTTEKQRLALEERANALTEKSINATQKLTAALTNADRQRSLQDVAGSDTTTNMGAGMAAALGVGSTLLTVGGALLTKKLLFKGGGGAIPNMLKMVTKSGGADDALKAGATLTSRAPQLLATAGAGGALLNAGGRVPLVDATGKVFSSGADDVARVATQKATEKAATTAATKGIFGAGANAGLKAFGRAIPFVGMGIGIMGAFDRIGRGDYLGAMGELGVGALSFIPGLGGLAASVGGSIALSARDSANQTREMSELNQPLQTSAGQGGQRQLVIKELVVKSVVELEGNQVGETVKKYIMQNAQVISDTMDMALRPEK